MHQSIGTYRLSGGVSKFANTKETNKQSPMVHVTGNRMLFIGVKKQKQVLSNCGSIDVRGHLSIYQKNWLSRDKTTTITTIINRIITIINVTRRFSLFRIILFGPLYSVKLSFTSYFHSSSLAFAFFWVPDIVLYNG